MTNTIPDETRRMIATEIENYGKMFHQVSYDAQKRGEKPDDTNTMYGVALMLVAAAIKDPKSIRSFMAMLHPSIFTRLGDMVAGYEAAKRTERDTHGTDKSGDRK